MAGRGDDVDGDVRTDVRSLHMASKNKDESE